MDPFVWPSFRQLAQAAGMGQNSIVSGMSPLEDRSSVSTVRIASLRDFMGDTAWRRGMAELLDWEEVDVEPLRSCYRMHGTYSALRNVVLEPERYLLLERAEMARRGDLSYGGHYQPRGSLPREVKFLVQTSAARHLLSPLPPGGQRRSPGYEVVMDRMLLNAEEFMRDRDVESAFLQTRFGVDGFMLRSAMFDSLMRSRAMSNDLGWLLENTPEFVFDLLVNNASETGDGTRDTYPGLGIVMIMSRKFRQYLTQPQVEHRTFTTPYDQVVRHAVTEYGAAWTSWYNPTGPHPTRDGDAPAPTFTQVQPGRARTMRAGNNPPPPPPAPPRKVFVPVRSSMGVRVQVVRQGDMLSVEPVTPPTARPRQSGRRIRRK